MNIEQLRSRLTPEVRTTLVRYARSCVAYHCATATPDPLPLPPPPPLPPDLAQSRPGLFVTLHTRQPGSKVAQLRGCIGRITGGGPTLPELIHRMGREASQHDPRFAPVQQGELTAIHIELSILSDPEPIADYRAIHLGTHGILLHDRGHSAVFLPQVAPEQGWNLAQTLGALSRKAGLPDLGWQENSCSFEVFEAVVFGESG